MVPIVENVEMRNHPIDEAQSINFRLLPNCT